MQDDVLMVEISGVKSTPGAHKYVITLTDQYDLPTVLEVPYVVKVNHVPAVASEIGSLTVNGIKGQTEIDVNEWFTDEDNESLFAVVTVADRSIVSTAVDGGKVTFTKQEGRAHASHADGCRRERRVRFAGLHARGPRRIRADGCLP